MGTVPFHLRYTLSRRQRLAPLVMPWLPCLCPSLGFTLGICFLARVVSPWFLPLLVIPLLMCRGFLALLFDVAVRPGRPVDVAVDDTHIRARLDGETWHLPLTGVIQVYRSGDDTWTVLHLADPALIIPADAITPEQLDYLKGFALRAAAARKAASAHTAE